MSSFGFLKSFTLFSLFAAASCVANVKDDGATSAEEGSALLATDEAGGSAQADDAHKAKAVGDQSPKDVVAGPALHVDAVQLGSGEPENPEQLDPKAGTGSRVAVGNAARVTCSYTVTTNDAPVRENPSFTSVIRKTKSAGSLVTGPCVSLNSGGVLWTALDCGCASDGIGWMVSGFLR